MECLTGWLRGLSVLRIFWAKRIREVEVVSRNPPALTLRWQWSRRSTRAVLALRREALSECLESLQGLGRGEGIDLLLVTGFELARDLYDRWSKVFIYDVDGSFLEPNREVSVEVYRPKGITDHIVSAVETVQRSSWGFYKPPPRGDYLLVAKLPSGKPVGSAYYNLVSSNIDYGVHVSKQYWRHRIGTRLLVEIAKLARSLGHRWVSVVRVIRGTKPMLSDRRAIAFYRANNPRQELNVYRLTIS